MRVYMYLVLTFGLMVLLNIMGISGTMGGIYNYFGGDNPENFSLTDMFLTAAAVFATVSLASIAIGVFIRTSLESIMLIPYVTGILVFAGDVLFLTRYMQTNYGGWLASITLLIFMPLAVGYVHSVISWWGGKD